MCLFYPQQQPVYGAQPGPTPPAGQGYYPPPPTTQGPAAPAPPPTGQGYYPPPPNNIPPGAPMPVRKLDAFEKCLWL